MSVVAILGHTASGKSAVAEAVAARHGAEIVSVDSMQVYRRMDIGTAKPTLQVRELIPHHMVDVADPSDDFDVVRFQEMARTVISRVLSRGGRIVIVGGSGLHYRAIVDPYSFAPTDPAVRLDLERHDPESLVARLRAIDPEVGVHVDLGNPRRVLRALEVWTLTGETPTQRATSEEARRLASYTPLLEHTAFGLDAGPKAHELADARFDHMMEAGLLDEVAAIRPEMGRVASQAVGYKELIPVVDGEASLADGVEAAKRATGALIKRQRTFFGRDPRIAWLPWQDDEDARVIQVLEAIGRTGQWNS